MSTVFQITLFLIVGILSFYETQHKYEFLAVSILGLAKTLIEAWLRGRNSAS